MKHLIPSLAILAVIGATPAFAANFTDDFTLKPSAVIQLRDQFGASGTNSSGGDYNIFNGSNGSTESQRFSIRRCRVGFEAKNSDGFGGQIQIRAGEKQNYGSANGNSQTSASSNDVGQLVTLYYANIFKSWKTENFTHKVTGGQYKPFNAESSISSSTYLFPSDRAVAGLIEARGIGIGYQGSAIDQINYGVDIQNGNKAGTTDVYSPSTNSYSSETNGMFYSARVEFSPTKELMAAKKMESYAGAEGTSVVIGFDYQVQQDQLQTAAAAGTANNKNTVTTYGPDINVHFNNLSLLAEYRMRTTKTDAIDTNTASYSDIKANAFDIVAGYAFTFDSGIALEPAVRFAKVDMNKDNRATDGTTAADAVNSPYTGEWNGQISGQEWGIGLNAYWNGHKNKTQLAYTSWTGEQPDAPNLDQAKAHVITLQQQITF